MKKLRVIGLTLMLAALFVTPVFADKAADEQAIMDSVMTRVDYGELTIDQALAMAIEQDLPFSLIVASCQAHGIALSHIITAAASVGMSSEVALAKMADAGVSKEQMSLAISQASGQDDTGLGYTPAKQTARITAVQPVTSNPGGTAQGGTVSPSSL